MNAWLPTEALGLLLLAVTAAGAPVSPPLEPLEPLEPLKLREAAGAQEAVQEPFARGDLGAALEAARALEDPVLRAEWGFHLLYQGGDLPGALAAAREGLEHAPSHAGLLKNAAVGALGLSRGELARDLAHRLVHDVDLSGMTPDEAQAFRERALELEAQAEELVALDQRAQLGQNRARRTVLVLTGLCLALMLWLGLSSGTRGRAG